LNKIFRAVFQTPLCKCVGYMIGAFGAILVLVVMSLVVAETIQAVFFTEFDNATLAEIEQL
jgi:hypothetical protein